MKINRAAILSSIIIVLVWLFLPTLSSSSDTTHHMALIPLDSRPCNTSYITYVSQTVGKHLIYPEKGLDHYARPSDSVLLYEFLYQSIPFADTYIIFTNQLINGGLISSRDPASYHDLDSKLQEFDSFIRFAKENNKKIVVSSVIPRVIPSQFTPLREYSRELILFSQNYGNLSAGADQELLESVIPEAIIEDYLSIYRGSDLIIDHVKSLVEEGLVDLFVIGQDDTYPQSINNKYLHKYFNYQHPDIIVQPGADELTRLIISRFIREENNWAPLELSKIYTNYELADQVARFEAFSTKTRAAQLLEFLAITDISGAPEQTHKKNRVIIHNDPEMKTQTLLQIDKNRYADYLALIDIAYINRGDSQLFHDLSLLHRLDGYSGWNTVGNAIGTELANFVVFDFLQRQLHSFPPEQQKVMLENYFKMQYIHYADDYLYQSILRTKLNQYLAGVLENPADISDKMRADVWLAYVFASEQKALNQTFTRDYYRFGQTFRITEARADIWLPWERTFEAMIVPQISISFLQ